MKARSINAGIFNSKIYIEAVRFLLEKCDNNNIQADKQQFNFYSFKCKNTKIEAKTLKEAVMILETIYQFSTVHDVEIHVSEYLDNDKELIQEVNMIIVNK